MENCQSDLQKKKKKSMRTRDAQMRFSDIGRKNTTTKKQGMKP